MEEGIHVISMLVHNRSGVLSRVAGVFGRLGYNIESLCVAETTNPKISRITLVSRANADFTEKIKKHLDRLVDVIQVTELSQRHSIQKEMMLLGIYMKPENRKEIMQAIEMFGCKIVSIRDCYCIIESVRSRGEIETILNYFEPMGIVELARTGMIALQQKKSNNEDQQ
ncbi:MAG: acetolactate synthase small subunit [Deltaproteobacteria bacterium]|nr:acetolactate synthase small subunit [Deltaproteobacteria bacterium]